MIVYADSSAIAPLFKDEATSNDAASTFDGLRDGGHVLVTSYLAVTELMRLAQREGIPPAAVDDVLDGLHFMDVSRADYRRAGRVGQPHLGTLDALHLQSAIRVGADAMLTLDTRLAESAEADGVPVLPIRGVS